MVTEVRSLRVDAQLNDQYSTTAKKIEEANRGIGASGKTAADGLAGVGAAANDTVTKITRANDGIERMKRQLIAGYASSVDFERGLRTIATGLDKGKLSAEQASAAIEGLTRKYGQNANAAQFAERGQLEFARAIEQANAKIAANAAVSEKAIDAQRRLTQAANQNSQGMNGARPHSNSYDTGNIVAQFQDIGITAAMGMSPMTIALQQGSQLSAVLSQSERPLQALMAGFAGLLSPVSLATVAVVGLGAAAIQYFSSTDRKAKTTDEVLAEHQKQIERVGVLWGDAAEKRNRYGSESTAGVSLGLEGSISSLSKRLQEASKGRMFGHSELEDAILSATTSPSNLAKIGNRTPDIQRQIAEFRAAVEGLRSSAEAGTPDVLKFVETLERIGQSSSNSGIKQIAIDAISAFQPLKDLANALREVDIQRAKIFNDRGPNGMLLSQGATNRGDMGDLALYQSREQVEMRRRQQMLDAQLDGMRAKTPDEKAAAARAAEAAQYNDSESPAQRRFRIEQAGTIALAQAEQQLSDARRERARSLDADLERQQFEMTLIGKTSTEIEALRKQYELIANLKAEAAKSGLAVDQQEIDLIKRKTDEYGRLAEQMGRSKMQFDLGRQLSDSGLSSIDRRTAQTLRQYGQPEDLGSQQATDVRNIYRQMDAQEAAKGFLTSFQAELVASGGDVGDAFSKALRSSLSGILSKMLDESLSSLGNALVGALFKGSGGSGAGGSGKNTGAVGSAGLDAVSKQFNGAAPVTPVERAPLGDMAAYAKAIQSIESGGNYGALGPITKNGDRAYGAYQVMGNNIGPWSKAALGQSISTQQFLSNPALQDKIFQHRFGGYVDKFGPSGAAQAWFGGPGSVGKGGAWTDVLGTSGNSYVEKFNDSLERASSGLGNFGAGLGKFGQSLGSAGSGAGSGGDGGGLFSFLGKLLGGTGKTSGSLYTSDRLLRAADGTPSSPGGLTMVGERGRELVNLPRGSQVIPSHQTESLLARGSGERGSDRQSRPTTLQVVIQGASGDDHVRSLVNEGVQTALQSHNEQQRRSGFGQVQNRYMSQKG